MELFRLTSTMIRVYRGDQGMLEYMGAGLLTGALFRLNLGLKGMFAGGVVGAALGMIPGAATLLMKYGAGYTMEDVEKVQYEIHAKREEYVYNSYINLRIYLQIAFSHVI